MAPRPDFFNSKLAEYYKLYPHLADPKYHMPYEPFYKGDHLAHVATVYVRDKVEADPTGKTQPLVGEGEVSRVLNMPWYESRMMFNVLKKQNRLSPPLKYTYEVHTTDYRGKRTNTYTIEDTGYLLDLTEPENPK